MYLTLLVTPNATSRVCKFTIKSWVILGKPALVKSAAVNVILSPTLNPVPEAITNTLYFLFCVTDTVSEAFIPLPFVVKGTLWLLKADGEIPLIGCCCTNIPIVPLPASVNSPSWLIVSAQNQVSPRLGKKSSDKKSVSVIVDWLNHCILKK